VKIKFTKHVENKLKEGDSIKLKINSKKIKDIIKKSAILGEKLDQHHSIGELNQKLSLSVIWKMERGIIKVITFYPSRKGRYESKILQRR